MDPYEDILDYCPVADQQHDLSDFPYDPTAPEWETTDEDYLVSVECSHDCGMELEHGLYKQLRGMQYVLHNVDAIAIPDDDAPLYYITEHEDEAW